MTGDSADLLSRVLKILPPRWFAWVAPIRDALLGGLSDGAAKNYSLYLYAKAQSRIATATGPFLDLIAYDFLGRYLLRNGLQDGPFRTLILATILQERVTRAGMIKAIQALTGTAPSIFEPWNTYDTGAYGVGTMGYGVGRGGWGNMKIPATAFMVVSRGAGSGVPNVGGYGNSIGSYGRGQIEYVGPQVELSGITDAQIYRVINQTRPSGAACWVALQNAVKSLSLTSETGILLTDDAGNQLGS